VRKPTGSYMNSGLHSPSKKTDVPIYSFEKHAREAKTSTVYSPHVLILEGIFALHDQRVLDLLDLKVNICLSPLRFCF
jgi:uridine kinase